MDVILGHYRTAICRTATSWEADLVMLGSSDPGLVARLLLGSTAHSVLRRAPCSVEIVRPPASGEKPLGEGMKILVATDRSEYSIMALDSVANRPWPKGSEVKVLSVPEAFIPVNSFHTSTRRSSRASTHPQYKTQRVPSMLAPKYCPS